MTGPVNVYAQGTGTASIAQPIVLAVAPGPTNVNFPIGQIATVPSTGTAYILVSKSTSNGVTSASWTTISSASGDVDALAGDSGTATPTAGSITIAGGSGVTTSAAGSTVTVSLTGGGLAIDSITPNSGTTPVVPDGAGLVSIVGAGSVTTVGGTNTLTAQLTGLTNHAVLVGAGTTTITKVGPTATALQVLQSAGSSADPVFSTATYPATTTVSQILYSSSTNVVGGLATANQGVLTTGTSGIPVITSIATNGQLIIGSTAGAPAAAVLTPGAGISITNGSNSITIATDGAATLSTLTGNSGGAISPTTGNINVVGSGTLAFAGSGSTLTGSITPGSSLMATVTGNSGGAISPTTGNTNIVGSGVLAFAGSGSTLTGSVTPGSSLIATLTGDTGGALSPTTGNFGLVGTANQITAAGSGSTITWSLSSTLIAPGSVTASTTLTASSGAITATNGNFVLGTLGNKIIIPVGSNGSVGTSGNMSGSPGAVTVTTTASSATAKIFYARATTGGTPGEVSITAQDGSGFTLTSTADETSTFNWWIINA